MDRFLNMKACFFLIGFFNCCVLLAQNTEQLIPYRAGEKWGYCTAKKEIVIQPQYESVQPFTDGVAQVILNKEVGLIDRNNKPLVPFGRQRYAFVGNGLFIKAFKNDSAGVNMGVINSENKIVVPFEYEYINPANGVFELKKQGKHGLCDHSGKILITPDKDKISLLEKTLYTVAKDNLEALYNVNGEQLTEHKYMVIDGFRNNLSKVRLKDLFGFINRQGKEIIAPVYEMVFPFSGGYAVIQKGKKWGLIDTLGKIVIQPKYDQMSDTHSDVASVKSGARWGLVNTAGKEITKLEFDEIARVYEGNIAVKKNNKWAIINSKGQILTPFQFDEVKINEGDEKHVRDFGVRTRDHDAGYLLVAINKKWGIVDLEGKIILKTEYDYVYPFSNNTALVQKNNKWAIADSKGNIKTEFIYDKLEPYLAGVLNLKKHGIILYQRDKLWGIIDTDGKEIIPPSYEFIRPADDNYYVVTKNKKMGVIDSKGKEIISAKYDKVSPQHVPGSTDKFVFVNNVCVVQYGKKGYVSKEGLEYFR